MWGGADPGGKKQFGVATLRDDGTFSTTCVSCADDALAWLPLELRGLGIDSPMWWASSVSSDRYADKWIRGQFKRSSGTVQAANSLRGAALVQGHMLAVRARENSPKLPITEAHPKALLKALKLRSWNEISKAFSLQGSRPNEHERDAVLAAVAAREGFCGRWKIDLAQTRDAREQDTSKLAFGNVNYWWPGQQAMKS